MAPLLLAFVTSTSRHIQGFIISRAAMAARTISRSCLQLSHEAPASRAFLRIVSQRPLHTTPIFDFLAPGIAQPAFQRAGRRNIPFQESSSGISRRDFTTSRTSRATAAIHNPKKDDDGNDMHIEITPRASNVGFASLFDLYCNS